MFKKVFFSILVVAQINSFAQWIEVNSNVTERLTEMNFIDENIGFCIGDNGTLIKTIDGGDNWFAINFGTEDFKQIYFLDAQTGIVSSNTAIYKTNNGTDFTDISSNFNLNNYNLTEVNISFKNQFGIVKIIYVNPNNILDVLIKSFKTFDFGDSWQEITDDGPLDGFHYIIDENTYYLVGFDLKKTTDGGVNWDTIPNVFFGFPPFQKTFKIHANNKGVATTSYTYEYVTFDLNENSFTEFSGNVWYESYDFVDTIGFYLSVGFSTSNNIIYKTTDYGITTSEVYSFDNIYSFYCLHFINEDLGFVCGENGKILKITNANSLYQNEIIFNDDINIYPIPARNIINIETELVIKSIQINSIDGELIKTYKNNFDQIDIVDLKMGQYFIEIHTEKGIRIEKIIIEK